VLPFVTAPAPRTTRRVGNSHSGTLELEVRGGLTVGEAATISELVAEEQMAFVRGAQIADAIATEEGISILEAFDLVEKALTGAELEEAAQALRIKHAERIAEVGRLYAASGQRRHEASVTALIRSRCSLPQWSLDDTSSLDKALFNDILRLVEDETAAEGRTAEAPTESELKKQPQEPGSPRKRTGAKSPSTSSTASPASSTEAPSPQS
jgi:hypothetical protein